MRIFELKYEKRRHATTFHYYDEVDRCEGDDGFFSS